MRSYQYSSENIQINRNNRAFTPNSLKKHSLFISYIHENFPSILSLEHILMNFNKLHSDKIYPSLRSIYNWCYKKTISNSRGATPSKQRKKGIKDPIDVNKNIL